MAKVHGIDGMTDAEIHAAVDQGGRFVVYQYCISIIFMSFKRSSGVYFVPAHKSAVVQGLPFVALSMLLGWWGIPWGPIWTIATAATNLGGGTEVTEHFDA